MPGKIKLRFLSAFRDFFIYHHKSLEFRAKIFAAIISAKFILNDIVNEIYENDQTRKDFLIQTVREYVARVKRNDRITLDTLLLSIDKDMKDHKRYTKKIDFSHLRRLMSGCEEEILVQQRVYEFLINEVKLYSQSA